MTAWPTLFTRRRSANPPAPTDPDAAAEARKLALASSDVAGTLIEHGAYAPALQHARTAVELFGKVTPTDREAARAYTDLAGALSPPSHNDFPIGGQR